MTSKLVRAAPLIILLLLPGLASAQHAEGSANDAAGDVESRPVPLVPMQAIDIRAGSVILDSATLRLDVAVESLALRDPTPATAPEYWLEFEHAGETFHFALLLRYGLDTPVAPVAALYRGAGTNWKLVSEGEFGVDFEQNRILGNIALHDVVTEAGTQLVPGNRVLLKEIHSFYSTEFGSWHDRTSHSETPAAEDRAPFPDATELVVPGVPPGDLELRTANPIRYSNGEATTFHWSITAQNRLDAEAVARLSATGPDRFELRHPEEIRVPRSANASFDVYATVPFQHQHGSEETIQIYLNGSGVSASILLGVHYPEVPQPAGHHPTVWLHGQGVPGAAGPESGFLWLNTLETDETATATRLTPREGVCSNGATASTALLWAFPLEPALRIGLDARPDEHAVLQATLANDVPLPGLEISARLVHIHNSDRRAGGGLFEFMADGHIAIETFDSLPPGRHPLELQLPVPPDLDLIRPGIESNIAVMLAACRPPASLPAETSPAWTAAANGAPPIWLEPGGFVRLPLNEYHDPIEASPAGIVLETREARAAAAPGATVLFSLQATVSEGTFDLKLLGVHREQARLLTRERVVEGGEVLVAVAVPNDAAPGSVLEVILAAERVGRPTESAAQRLLVDVDPSSPRNDADRLPSPASDIPFPIGGPLLALTLMLAAAVRRKP